MAGLERAHLGETPASLGRDYLAEVLGRRCFVSVEERDLIVGIMESRYASCMADRVAEGTRVVAGLRPGPRRGGRFPVGRRGAAGTDLLALGEAHWYTEDPIFVRVFTELLAAWASETTARAAHRVPPWHRTAEIVGWCVGAQCMLSSSFLLERDATNLMDGLEREGRILSGWLHHHDSPAREKAAALAGLAFLGTVSPEAFGAHDWFDEGLGELALAAGENLDPRSRAMTPVDALQVYLPLVALSLRNGLDVPGPVLAGIEASVLALGSTRRRRDSAGVSLMPMIPAGEARVAALSAAGLMLLGRGDREALQLDDAGSGLVFLLGPEMFLGEWDLAEVAPAPAARAASNRPLVDTAHPAA